ncbi:unnamed protein product [Didymodactylos carnosus]|uniref:Uncharacterized protein n=1 Tax=Didymodactylos carnosus TaxID=1234261 RepID=A0A815V4G8_9BILA|nr:unnamed protein product [Didymodactylos carnosus]CAF4390476.1 unnamed protein product [Didymodactylos carnosus]
MNVGADVPLTAFQELRNRNSNTDTAQKNIQVHTLIKDTISSQNFLSDLHNSIANSPLISELCRQITSSPIFVQLISTLVSSKITHCEKQIEKLQLTVDELDNTATELYEYVDQLEMRYNELEQYNKRKNLIIHGIPETLNEHTDKIAMDIAKWIGHSLDEKSIYASHRLPTSNKNIPRPIVVGFLRYSDRQAIIKNRQKLRTHQRYKNVFINEHLSSFNNQLFQYARQNLNKRGIQTRNGNIFYIDSNNEKHRIQSFSDIDKLTRTQHTG